MFVCVFVCTYTCTECCGFESHLRQLSFSFFHCLRVSFFLTFFLSFFLSTSPVTSCICVCVFLCVFVRFCVWVSECLCVCLYIHVHIHVHVCVFLFLCVYHWIKLISPKKKHCVRYSMEDILIATIIYLLYIPTKLMISGFRK